MLCKEVTISQEAHCAAFIIDNIMEAKKKNKNFLHCFFVLQGQIIKVNFFFFFFKILGFDSLGIFLRNIFKVIYSEALFIYVGSSMKIRSKGNKIKCGITSSSFLMLIEHRV